MWRYGADEWCNLQGRYVHLTADWLPLFQEFGAYEMSICHLGVMGTREFRVSDPEPKNYVVPIGNSASIQIAYPEFSEEASSTWNLSL